MRFALLGCLFLAGHGTAGEAQVATYVQRDQGQAECELILVRTPDQVEYSGCGHPVRLWRRLGDGVDLLELHPDEGRALRYAPGDLRAMRRDAEWSQLSGLVADGLRDSLERVGMGRLSGRETMRYRGRSADGGTIELEWLPEAALPARYRHANGIGLELKTLRSLPAEQAFTATAGLQEIDGADLGD